MNVRLTYIYILFYVIGLFLFLNIWGIDLLEAGADYQFYADSRTYMELANDKMGLLEMIILNPNLIGPVYIARSLLCDYNLIFIFQSLVFFFSYKLITNHYEVKRYQLLLLWCLSPILMISILSINKEIFALYSLCLFLAYNKNRKVSYLLFSIGVGLLVRWQHVLFIVLAAILISKINVIREHKKTQLIVLLLGISLLYPLMQSFSSFSSLNEISEIMTEQENGSGINSMMIQMQNKPFGYVLVFIPKLLLLMFGLFMKIQLFGNKADFHNYTVVMSQCFFYLLIIVLAIIKRVKVNHLTVFLALLYCIIFNLTPIFAPRYLFLFYILMTIAVTEKGHSKSLLKPHTLQ